jgi:hypothetical protein
MKRALPSKTSRDGRELGPESFECRFETFRSFFSQISIGWVVPKMVVRKNSTHQQLLGLLHFLLQRCQNDSLDRGGSRTGAAFASIAKGAVGRLWREWHLRHTNSINGEWDVTSEQVLGPSSMFPTISAPHCQNFPCDQKRPFGVWLDCLVRLKAKLIE